VGPLAFRLMVLEAGLLFAAVCGTTFVWARASFIDWLDVLAVVGQALALAISCTVAFYYNDLYDLRIVRSFAGFAGRLVQAFGVAFILLAGFYALFPGTRLAEGPFVSSFLVMTGILLPLRALSYALMRARFLQERVLILGVSPLALQIVEAIEAQPSCRYQVIGVVADGPVPAALARYPVLGAVEHLGKLWPDLWPDRIVVTLHERRGRLPVTDLLEARFRGIMIEDGVETHERLTGKLAIETLRPSGLVFSRDVSRYQLDVALARATSLVVSAVGLVVTAPLLGLGALLVWLNSGRPVFFVQDRIGRGGRPFPLIKFRTMRPAVGPTSEWVRDNGGRLTRVGSWLRKFRLDELPQFVNILRGDMNLVGPRPHPVSNQELFNATIPYYSLRSLVRPGVTGWAQVRYGYANNLDEEIEKMRYDLYYIKHFSLWFDVRILVDTVKTVLFGRGSRATDAYAGASPTSVGASR
jgi:exopolysaccharide biosynthesis polyprenyl glycosylphosphotransferase